MKSTPLLMIEDMVSKTLDDLKTITRRIAKGVPGGTVKLKRSSVGRPGVSSAPCSGSGEYFVDKEVWLAFDERDEYIRSDFVRCPYGKAGDRIWIKETHYRFGKWIKNGTSKTGRQKWTFKPLSKEVKRFDDAPEKITKGRGKGWHKRPSIFMPRWASRLTLEIKSIRAERLHDISAEDAMSEGIDLSDIPGIGSDSSLINAFRQLWDSINVERDGGAYAWDKNPWVWVIEFRRVKNEMS